MQSTSLSLHCIKEGTFGTRSLQGKTFSTNWCVLSLPLDTWVSVGHNDLDHGLAESELLQVIFQLLVIPL